ncbi:MAG TPA: SgcJ/EcaC family oxidoreductase [Longimicrobium sp.]|jgi:uncharacterized protein (TIGR02246 family)|nr:SgcJ/EcaC family oxidoreductase [Longimicrobium sp.]
MNRSLCLLGIVAAIAVLPPASLAAQSPDEAAIREVEARQAAAWNRHDAAAYAALFTEDGDVVNVVGWWWRGRAEIEAKLAAAFAYTFRESTLTITDVDVRFLAPDIAVAHVRWTMAGQRMPPGMPDPGRGIQLQVLTRHGGQWSIASFQNTNSVPERPFPTGPGGAPPPAP